VRYDGGMEGRFSGLIIAAIVAVSAGLAPAGVSAAQKGLPADQGQDTGQGVPVGRSLHRLPLNNAIADHVNYLLFVPPAYARGTAGDWPLIVFLHGSEQRGDDPSLLQEMALLDFADKSADFPFIAVIPQCPRNIRWPPQIVKSVLDAVEAQLRVDRNRVYLTGFSLGGFGTWQTAAAFPGTFAAIAPLCGMSDLPESGRLAGIPVWAFHGAQDVNVPVVESKKMVSALQKRGADARLTVYPDLAHDCWTMTYNDSRLYLWFLDHSLAEGSRMAASSLSSDALLDR
jgi:predicted peptidase